MKKVTEFLSRLTTVRALILGFFFASVYYFFMYDNGDVLLKSIQIAEHETELQKKQLADVNQKLDHAHDYQKSAAEMGEALNRLLAYIPEDFRLQDFMKLVSEEAKVSGLNIIRISDSGTAKAGTSQEFDKELTVSVEFQGSFAQQMTFLANLTKKKQIFIVDKFRMEREGNGLDQEFPILAFRADIKAYRYAGGKPKS